MVQTTLTKGDVGIYDIDGERARVTVIHDSPPDQEAIEVVLLEDFRCLECGQIIEIQRHDFYWD